MTAGNDMWPDRPTFLGIGAEKTGSTSLHHYLAQHPDIFIPRMKEPSYFSTDDRPLVTDFDRYRQLFEGARSFPARGEVSARYFHSRNAPELIRRELPDVRLIGFLRNPVDRAYSHYLMLMASRERIPTMDFASALESRLDTPWHDSGDLVTEFCLYRSLYADNVERYLDAFGRDRAAFFLYEDLARDPGPVLSGIFSFLGVDPSFRPDLGVRYNVSAGVPRLRPLRRLVIRDSAFKRLMRRIVPPAARVPLRRSFMQGTRTAKQAIPDDLRSRLAEKYVGDIERVERLLSLDLSSWKPS